MPPGRLILDTIPPVGLDMHGLIPIQTVSTPISPYSPGLLRVPFPGRTGMTPIAQPVVHSPVRIQAPPRALTVSSSPSSVSAVSGMAAPFPTPPTISTPAGFKTPANMFDGAYSILYDGASSRVYA